MQNTSHDIKTSDKDSTAAPAQVPKRSAAHTRSSIDASPRITQQKKRQHDIFGPVMQQKSEEEDRTVNQPRPSIAPNLMGLPDEVKTNMEAGFNTDFSNIRVHTNSQNALKVNAMAYTQGRDIHFAPGQFNPRTSEGRQTIGHELTHVVQQQEGRVQPTGSIAGMPVNDSPTLEREADAMGVKVSSSTRREKTTQRKPKKKDSGIPQAIQRYPLRAEESTIDGILQRRVDWRSSPAGIITHISITGRPTWWRIAELRHPSQLGYDRRHIIAWTIIKRKIEDTLMGQNENGVRAFLLELRNFEDSAWAASDVMPNVEHLLDSNRLADAIEYYAKARFNDPGNLFMGPSQPNRALGVRILPAYRSLAELLEEWNRTIGLDSPLPEPYILRYPFWDSRTHRAEEGTIPINTWSDAVNWYANMALDWESFKDWENATPMFLEHLETINPELARVMEERAAKIRPDTPQV